MTLAQFTMPPFADRLADQDIADILGFVRTGWGRSANDRGRWTSSTSSKGTCSSTGRRIHL
jgi:mono/diheme cytochrome c family protein